MNTFKTEMEDQLISVPAKIIAAILSICSTVWGKILVIMTFITTYFLPVKDIIHVTLVLVLLDLILGVAVTIKTKGWSHILSSRLRDTLIKGFIYIIFIGGLYMIEVNVVDGYYVAAKTAFAIIGAVELWSMAANALILSPNMVFLRIFKKYLTQEMAKKLDMAQDDIEDFLKDKERNKRKNNKDVE